MPHLNGNETRQLHTALLPERAVQTSEVTRRTAQHSLAWLECRGRIEQVGTAKEILEKPATPFVMNFIADVNQIPSTCQVCFRSYMSSPTPPTPPPLSPLPSSCLPSTCPKVMKTKQVEQSQSHMCKFILESCREISIFSRRLLFAKNLTMPSVKLRILKCEAADAGVPCHHS